MAQRILIQLGRVGDVINILPVAEEENRNQNKLTLMVQRDFAGVLDGVSYCDKMVYDGDYSRVKPAEALARFKDPKAKVAQVWAHDMDQKRLTECYQRDSWLKIGYGRRWEQSTLIFDRRDTGREMILAIKAMQDANVSKPIVLLALNGHSSPFANAERLKQELVRDCGQDFSFVDISHLRAERIYDLLGLFDIAECLITVDTATLHLAQASSVPVISLVNSSTPWLASARRANHLVRMRYDQINTDCIKAALYSTQYRVGKLVHVYSEYKMSDDDQRRADVARESWHNEYEKEKCWQAQPVDYTVKLPRSSKTVLGDDRAVPFVRDMIEYGFTHAESPDDVVVLTNSDVGFSPGMTRDLQRLIACKGAAYCYRWDFDRLEAPIQRSEAVSGKFFGGLDLFAFSRTFWMKHREDLPDFVLGSTHWDLVARDWVKKHGGGELYGAIWHELHGSYWKVNPRTMGNMHNINLANLWWTTNDTTRPFTKI